MRLNLKWVMGNEWFRSLWKTSMRYLAMVAQLPQRKDTDSQLPVAVVLPPISVLLQRGHPV
jgi:hypothetical protein